MTPNPNEASELAHTIMLMRHSGTVGDSIQLHPEVTWQRLIALLDATERSALLDRRATDEGVFKFKVADVVELRTNTLFDEEGVPVGGDGGIIGCDAVVVEPDDNMTQVLVRWEDQDKEILGCPTNKLLLLQRMTSKTANELRDWRQMFAAYCALPMKPDGLWPNNWSQDVAMIAHALQPRSAAPDGEKTIRYIGRYSDETKEQYDARVSTVSDASSATSEAAFKMICSHCGADRLKVGCALRNISDCKFIGHPQTAQQQRQPPKE